MKKEGRKKGERKTGRDEKAEGGRNAEGGSKAGREEKRRKINRQR